MGGAPLLLAIAVVTVDAGWESDGRDGYRYIIQIPAEQLHEVERTGQITSQLPEELRGQVSSVVIKVGDDPLPRPDVPPRRETAAPEPASPEPASPEPASPESASVAEAEPSQVYLPSPDETVRAQGDTGPANSYGTSQFNGFATETQSRSGAAPTTSAPDTTTAASNSSVPSTSRNAAAGTATSPPTTGFAAADGNRDNRWFSGPQATDSGSAANPPGGSASTNSAVAAPTTAPSNSVQTPPAASSPWAIPGNDRSAASNPPSLSGAGNTAANPPSSASPRPNRSSVDDPPATAEARQREADRRLLEEVGIDASGHAYDKRTNQPLYENDARYPLIVDYVRRMEQAEKEREREELAARSRAAALPVRPAYDDRYADDRNAPLNRVPTAAGDSGAWNYNSANYEARGAANSYAPNPAYAQNPNFPPYSQQPPPNQPPASWGTDPRLAQVPQVPPAATPTTPVATQQPTSVENRAADRESEGQASPSDFGRESRASHDRDATVKTQPLFMFMLLLSIVGNIYMGFAISRLIRRYRTLVSTHRGTAITA